jgi:hypothetical protein
MGATQPREDVPLEERAAIAGLAAYDEWHPDEEFLAFLRTLPQRNPIGESAARCVMRLMRRGTPLGRTLYENSWKYFRAQYETYRSKKIDQ